MYVLRRVLFLSLCLTTSAAIAQPRRSAERQPAVFPPLTADELASRQAVIDSIPVDRSTKRPNIVLLFADDLGYADIGCFGSTAIPTPHIDELADNGMKFTNAYVTAGTCSPSRAGLLSGQYQQRFGFEFNTSSKAITERLGRGLDPKALMISDVLRHAGYRTGMVGKWHQGTRKQFHPSMRGFDEFYGFLSGAHGFIAKSKLTAAEVKAAKSGGDESPLLRGYDEEVEDEYLTDAFAREAEAFIGSQTSDKPFFLYVPFNAVHTPLQATQKYKDRFPNEKDLSRQLYYAMTSAMDDAVGRVVAAIESNGFGRNTLVVFFNDNGGPMYTGVQSNGPLRMGKLFLFEGGVRVPLIVKWPGVVKNGSVCDGATSALDLFPTFSRVAGATLPPTVPTDGVDLTDWLGGKRTDSPHESLFWRNGPNKAMRKGKWKLIEVPGHVWLFDLSTDIGERMNRATEYPEVVEELQDDFRQWEIHRPGTRMALKAQPAKIRNRRRNLRDQCLNVSRCFVPAMNVESPKKAKHHEA